MTWVNVRRLETGRSIPAREEPVGIRGLVPRLRAAIVVAMVALGMLSITVSTAQPAGASTISIDAFVARYDNQRVGDTNGAYVGECVSIVKRFHSEVLGGGSFTIPNGGASGMWTQYSQIPQLVSYYDRVDASNGARRGDLAVYGNGTYGHVAIVLANGAPGAATLDVFEQNSPIGSASHETTNRSKASLLGFLRPKADVGGGAGGRAADGSLIRTPNGSIYRVAGGAPLHLSSCAPFNGCAGVIAVPDLSAYLTRPVNGTTLATPGSETGRVYKIAGGAPLWLSNCSADCGAPVVVNQWTIDVLEHLNARPVNGTTLATPGSETGRIYKVAGGAPLWLSNCSADCGGPVVVNQWTIDVLDHLSARPANGTTLATPKGETGRVYKVAGGAPLWLSSCSAGCGAPVTVNQWTIDKRNHLRARPVSGTKVRVVGAKSAVTYSATTCRTVTDLKKSVKVSARSFVCISSSPTLPRAKRKVAYRTVLRALGYTKGLRWSVAKGHLAPGIKMNSAGVLTGRATKAGKYVVTVRARAAVTPSADTLQKVTLIVT